MTVMTSREFSEDVDKAKDAALDGPVIITERGREAYVLMTAEEFRKTQGGEGDVAEGAPAEVPPAKKTLVELLSYPEIADIEFDLPERRIETSRRIPDFSDDD